MKKIINGIEVELNQEEISYLNETQRRTNDKAYIINRAMSYPQIGEQLDAILKQFEKMRNEGSDLHPDLDIIVDKWRKVKTDNPK